MTKSPSKTVDCAGWFTKQQAATAIGVSTKTVEQYAKDGKIQLVKWKRPSGGPRVAMYEPEDVNRLAHRMSSAFVVTPASENGHGLASIEPPPNHLTLIEGVLRTIQKASQTSEKLFLTIPEAASFTGLSEAYLRRMCQAGTLGAIRDGGWKIPRSRLATLADAAKVD